MCFCCAVDNNDDEQQLFWLTFSISLLNGNIHKFSGKYTNIDWHTDTLEYNRAEYWHNDNNNNNIYKCFAYIVLYCFILEYTTRRQWRVFAYFSLCVRVCMCVKKDIEHWIAYK